MRMSPQVYLAAISRHVPSRMVKVIRHFLEFCYLVRCETISEDDLAQIRQEVSLYHQEHEVFRDEDIHPEGFSLP